MGPADFDRLSDYQRDCLRRTFRHQTSKEIARDLGKSKYAIDQAIERAVRTLGASSRIDAARALAEHEGASDRITGDPVHLVAPPLPAPLPDEALGITSGRLLKRRSTLSVNLASIGPLQSRCR